MTKADLIEEVSRAVAMPRKESEMIVDAIFDSVRHALRRADKVEVRGFWQFSDAPARVACGAESKDRRIRGSAREEDRSVQARQRVETNG